jgi:hypothetical protein
MVLTEQRKFGKTKVELEMALTRQKKFGKTKKEQKKDLKRQRNHGNYETNLHPKAREGLKRERGNELFN